MSRDLLDKGQAYRCPHCGTIHPRLVSLCPETNKTVSAAHKYAGRVLDGKYQVERIIGEGGMGVVYLGIQTNIQKKVAVKFFNPDACTDRECMDRFVNEARFSAAIGHANIINIFHFGYVDETVPYIVMEYLEGESLGRALLREKVFPVERALEIAHQVLDALRAVHASNILHRDLKPENVFLARQTGGNEIVKLLDFGISRLMKPGDMSERLREAGKVYGTPYYASPEQAEGKLDVDHRADLYSTGVLLFEMLTGQLPFRSKSYGALLVEILTRPPPNPRELSEEIPTDLVRVIMKALDKDPDARYQDAREMMDDLRSIRTMLEGNVFPQEVKSPADRLERKRRPTDPGTRSRSMSPTAYSLMTPEDQLDGDSPYLKARQRRVSQPPVEKEKSMLTAEERAKLEEASSEIINILGGLTETPAPPEDELPAEERPTRPRVGKLSPDPEVIDMSKPPPDDDEDLQEAGPESRLEDPVKRRPK
jgi:serine/threonine protein kinase